MLYLRMLVHSMYCACFDRLRKAASPCRRIQRPKKSQKALFEIAKASICVAQVRATAPQAGLVSMIHVRSSIVTCSNTDPQTRSSQGPTRPAELKINFRYHQIDHLNIASILPFLLPSFDLQAGIHLLSSIFLLHMPLPQECTSGYHDASGFHVLQTAHIILASSLEVVPFG